MKSLIADLNRRGSHSPTRCNIKKTIHVSTAQYEQLMENPLGPHEFISPHNSVMRRGRTDADCLLVVCDTREDGVLLCGCMSAHLPDARLALQSRELRHFAHEMQDHVAAFARSALVKDGVGTIRLGSLQQKLTSAYLDALSEELETISRDQGIQVDFEFARDGTITVRRLDGEQSELSQEIIVY